MQQKFPSFILFRFRWHKVFLNCFFRVRKLKQHNPIKKNNYIIWEIIPTKHLEMQKRTILKDLLIIMKLITHQ